MTSAYRKWSDLYFPAFYYTYGKLNDDEKLACAFASWFATQAEHGEREISEAFITWKEIQDDNDAEQKLDTYVKGDPNA